MKLTQDQRLTLGRLFKEKVGDFPACDVCGNQSGYSIAGSLVRAPPVQEDEGVTLAGPFVAVSCTQCGHTRLFHARVLGLLPSE